MKRAFLILLAGAALSACGRVGADGSYDKEAVRREVATFVNAWSDAGERGDFEALGAMYADEDGFAWIERGVVQYKDHAAILEGLASVKSMNATIASDVSNIAVAPLARDAAAVHADITQRVETDAFAFGFEGVFVAVAVKRGDDWKFLQGAFSEKPEPQQAGEPVDP